MDVLFVNPSSALEAYQKLAGKYAAIEPPTWTLLLSKAIEAQGFSNEILDCDALGLTLEDSVRHVKDSKAKILCFVMYGQNPNSGTTCMIGATKLAKAIKDSGIESKICFIGSHTSSLPKEVLSLNYVDFIFYNEGVIGLIELLKTNLRDRLEKVSSLGFKKEDNSMIINPVGKIVSQEDMDIMMPGYNWEKLPKKKNPLDLYRSHYWHSNFSDEGRSPFAAIYTSLGCAFACNFCMINIVNRTNSDLNANAANFKGMRHWSPDLILDEFQKLHEYGVHHLRPSDETFFLNKKYHIPILEVYKEDLT